MDAQTKKPDALPTELTMFKDSDFPDEKRAVSTVCGQPRMGVVETLPNGGCSTLICTYIP